MNVLVLSPYPREGASFRFRILQYLPSLEAAGIHCTVRCFLTSPEFERVHQPRQYLVKGKAVVAGTMRLAASLSKAKAFDVILVHRELYPLGVSWFERWLRRLDRPVILDVDDAIFLPQPHGDRTLGQFRNPAKVGRIAQASRLVIVSNEYLAHWFRRYNPSIAIVPTAVDTDRFCPRPTARPDGPVTIGWIGSPSTGYYLAQLLPALERLRRLHQFTFKVIGAGAGFQSNGSPLVQQPWRLDREVEDFQSLDIGVYPLPDDAWAAGKGGFKSIQYMAAGVPVVASPVGMNTEIIRDGDNGFLARTVDDWVRILSHLLEDDELRVRIGSAGRRTAVEHYSTAVQAPRFVSYLREAVQ